mmetsp:Transcript_65119/g.130914  ORF Transcript_65119/g.130914 Transcript_65119/m.130914 type:complete len:202 (+) Transcript_65119:141-746(+)
MLHIPAIAKMSDRRLAASRVRGRQGLVERLLRHAHEHRRAPHPQEGDPSQGGDEECAQEQRHVVSEGVEVLVQAVLLAGLVVGHRGQPLRLVHGEEQRGRPPAALALVAAVVVVAAVAEAGTVDALDGQGPAVVPVAGQDVAGAHLRPAPHQCGAHLAVPLHAHALVADALSGTVVRQAGHDGARGDGAGGAPSPGGGRRD